MGDKLLKDIQQKQDIVNLVNLFYTKVRDNKILSGHFINVDWNYHLPIMYDFWENVIFHTGNYSGNPMAKHQMLSQSNPISNIHFSQWLKLFTETINELYEGENASLLVERAKSIASIMEVKILNNKH